MLPYALEMLALRRLTTTAFGTLMALEPAIGTALGLVVLRQQPDAAAARSLVLGGAVVSDYGSFLVVAAHGRMFGFQQVPDRTPGKNAVHVDFGVEDKLAEADRLVGLGATFVEARSAGGHEWIVLRDPEGNEFCLTTPL